MSTISTYRIINADTHPFVASNDKNKWYTIIFEDGEKIEICEEQLFKLDFFRTCFQCNMKENLSSEISLKHWGKEDFQIIISLMFEEKSIFDILSSEDLENPHLLEYLEELFGFFCLNDADNLMQRVQKQLEDLPYASFVKILENYQNEISKIEELLSPRKKKYPKMVEKAVDIYLYYFSFPNPEHFYNTIKEYQKKISELEDRMNKRNSEMNSLLAGSILYEMKGAEIQCIDEEINVLNIKLKDLQKVRFLSITSKLTDLMIHGIDLDIIKNRIKEMLKPYTV